MTTALFSRLAAQLRSIEDELATSVHRSSPQVLDSVSTAMVELLGALKEIRDAAVPDEDGHTKQGVILQLEQAAMCGRRAAADSGVAREQYVANMIAHIHAAYLLLAVAVAS